MWRISSFFHFKKYWIKLNKNENLILKFTKENYKTRKMCYSNVFNGYYYSLKSGEKIKIGQIKASLITLFHSLYPKFPPPPHPPPPLNFYRFVGTMLRLTYICVSLLYPVLDHLLNGSISSPSWFRVGDNSGQLLHI